jgi:hypothetical protein
MINVVSVANASESGSAIAIPLARDETVGTTSGKGLPAPHRQQPQA